MGTKTIGVKERTYERLKAHKRGDESFSETLDRILGDVDADWRTHAGFLSEDAADDFATEIESGLDDLDDSLSELGDRVDEENEATSSDANSGSDA
jgi:predicted CopG family antitoxin